MRTMPRSLSRLKPVASSLFAASEIDAVPADVGSDLLDRARRCARSIALPPASRCPLWRYSRHIRTRRRSRIQTMPIRMSRAASARGRWSRRWSRLKRPVSFCRSPARRRCELPPIVWSCWLNRISAEPTTNTCSVHRHLGVKPCARGPIFCSSEHSSRQSIPLGDARPRWVRARSKVLTGDLLPMTARDQQTAPGAR